jgi:hypothetical protein
VTKGFLLPVRGSRHTLCRGDGRLRRRSPGDCRFFVRNGGDSSSSRTRVPRRHVFSELRGGGTRGKSPRAREHHRHGEPSRHSHAPPVPRVGFAAGVPCHCAVRPVWIVTVMSVGPVLPVEKTWQSARSFRASSASARSVALRRLHGLLQTQVLFLPLFARDAPAR